MKYKQRFMSVEDYLQHIARRKVEDIEKEGYLYYSEAACRHIDLLSKPEAYMNGDELEAKRRALNHIGLLKSRANGEVVPTMTELEYWEFIKDQDIPEWRIDNIRC